MKPWICIGSGPSLTLEDVEYCQGRAHVLVINDNFRMAPWADILYACDKDWWDYYVDAVWDRFKGELWTQIPKPADLDKGQSYAESAAGIYHLNYVECRPKPGLSVDPKTVHGGGNGGYQGINLALHQINAGIGARRIGLLGYDFHGSHWFGEHPQGLRNTHPKSEWLKKMDTIRPQEYDLEIANLSPGSAIQTFPKHQLRAWLT